MSHEFTPDPNRPFLIEARNHLTVKKNESAKKEFKARLFDLFRSGLSPENITTRDVMGLLGTKDEIETRTRFKTLTIMGVREGIKHFYTQFLEQESTDSSKLGK